MRARVLHVLPSDHARGAQVYARALCDELGGSAAGHRIVVVFDGPTLAARADDALAVPRSGRLAGSRARLLLTGLVRRLRPEVVVAHGAEAVKYVAPIAGLPRRPRLVLYAIGTALPKAHRPAVRLAYSALLRLPDAVVGVSSEVVQETASLFRVGTDRLRCIPNGRGHADAPTTDLRARAVPRVGFVGYLTDSKRPATYLDVVAALRRGGFEGGAWMAGDGPLLDDLREPAAAAAVDVLGRREDVPALLAQTDLLLFTSIPAGEGMPGVLIEAGLAGVPVVTTDVPGARTVVLHEQTGCVVPVADAGALTAAAAGLLADRDRRVRMGAAAREHCAREFSLETSAQRWRELFADVTGTTVSGW